MTLRRVLSRLLALFSGRSAGPEDVLLLDSGPVSLRDDGVYKGVPYAAPPVGNLRFRPPAPPPAWTAPLGCDVFGPACPQPDTDEDTSEDCLTLNVWTPAKTADDRLPVMVFFHGGAFMSGSGSLSIYDGATLAKTGTVVVTCNYRLGALGFLAHPALSAESGRGVSGNYGLLDQQAALEWVSRNIAAFGGDPQNVTIFGQSAGATSVVLHLFRPEASGLFVRAIAQSPVGPGALRPLKESVRGAVAAEAVGLEFARRLGVDPASDNETALAALRSASVAALLAASEPDPALSVEVAGILFCPTVDGVVVTDHPLELVQRGQPPDKPLIIGTATHEASLFLPGLDPPVKTPEAYGEFVTRRFGPDAATVLSLAPCADKHAWADLSRLLTTRWFTAFSLFLAKAMTEAGRPVWLYRYAAPPPLGALAVLKKEAKASGLTRKQAGVPHSADLFSVFGFTPWYLGYGPKDRDMARTMRAYWTDFARTGDPNRSQPSTWPRLDTDRPQMLVFGPQTTSRPLPEDPLAPLVETSWRTTAY